MYAFIHASEFLNKSDIRLVSIGTTHSQLSSISSSASILYWLNNLVDLMVATEITTHTYLSREMAEDYHRYQIYSDLSVSSLDSSSVANLKKLANELLEKNLEDIKQVIHDLCDEKLGSS